MGPVLLLVAALLAQSPAPTPPQTIAAGANIAVIPIEGPIYDYTLEMFKRCVDRAVAGGATMIVIELDTPGGYVGPALKIARYIKSDIPVPVVAWVHNEAYSAGILIASACSQIIMSPSSVTGDCAPIVPGMNIAPTERAKALSPILEEFRDNARANHHDYTLFHAMCVLGVEVYEIEHKETGQRMLVNQADYEVMVEGKPLTEVMAAYGGGRATTQPSLGTSGGGTSGGVSPEESGDADRGQWKKIRFLHDGKTLLTLNQSRAKEIGLSRASDVRNFKDVKNLYNANSVTSVPVTWSESMVGWLVWLPVRSVLLLIVLVCGYIELHSPGIGWAGGAALIALGLLLGAPFFMGLSQVWHIILFFIGFILLMIELLVIPGFGVIGVLGIACMITGLVLAVVPTSGTGPINLPTREVMGQFWESLSWMLVAMVGSAVAMYFLIAHFEHIPGLGAVILQGDGASPTGPPTATAATTITLGAEGRVVTGLRPSGRVEIDGQIIDVVAVGGWVEPGTRVKVIQVQGNRVVVDRV